MGGRIVEPHHLFDDSWRAANKKNVGLSDESLRPSTCSGSEDLKLLSRSQQCSDIIMVTSVSSSKRVLGCLEEKRTSTISNPAWSVNPFVYYPGVSTGLGTDF